MKKTAAELFRQTAISTDDTVYTMVKLPSDAIVTATRSLEVLNQSFSVLIADRYEVTLVVPIDFWQSQSSTMPRAFSEGRFRLITFESVLAFDVVGFMAYVAHILTEAGISILPFAAFSRDHLLIAEDRFDQAWDALRIAQHEGT
jgi:hypothetical protein